MGISISYGSRTKKLEFSGTGVTATMATSGCQMANNIVVSISDENLIASNIKSGVTIFGITGTYTGSAAKITIINKTDSADGDVEYALSANGTLWPQDFTTLSPKSTTSIDISGYNYIKFNNTTANNYRIYGVFYEGDIDYVPFPWGETGSYAISSGQYITIEEQY